MTIRFVERLIAALAGLVMLVLGLAGLAWGFGLAASWFATLQAGILWKIVIGAVLVVLGLFNIGLLFRRGRGKKGFVLQTTENGELSISIKAMESLVKKCVDKHEELHVLSTQIKSGRDGVIVSMRISLANGVSIPLAVNSLQKQIKQYITACSGVDVNEVRVQVETTGNEVKDSPYAVPEADIELSPEPQAPEAAKLPVMEEPEAAPAEVVEIEEEQERPLHQRLFGHDEQPAIVPPPPEQEETLNQDAQEENADE